MRIIKSAYAKVVTWLPELYRELAARGSLLDRELDEMKRKFVSYANDLEEFGVKITWFEKSFDIKDSGPRPQFIYFIV